MFPGGHVEPGESLLQSVIREMKEETGLDIKNHSSVVSRIGCEKRFRVHGSIWEYPLGAYNYEDISVEALEEDDEEE